MFKGPTLGPDRRARVLSAPCREGGLCRRARLSWGSQRMLSWSPQMGAGTCAPAGKRPLPALPGGAGVVVPGPLCLDGSACGFHRPAGQPGTMTWGVRVP